MSSPEAQTGHMPPLLSLLSENPESLDSSTLQKRFYLAQQLKALPADAFERIQYLQPQVGCFNRCAFCSQSAGKEIWQLTKHGLADLISAIKAVMPEKSDDPLAEGRKEHKPGVIYPYLDNDILSYPYFYEYIKYVSEDLGAQIRISSVGYSRHNEQLQPMHERIASELSSAIAGIRFSFTPYTHGWTQEQSGLASREEYIRDFANTIKIYKPVMELRGIGRDEFCVELRFKPNIVVSEERLQEEVVNGNLIIKIGPYIVIAPDISDIPISSVVDIADGKPVFSQPPAKVIIKVGNRKSFSFRSGEIYKFTNPDGYYYAIDPVLKPDGKFEGLHLYPKTDQRPKSGFIDSQRHLLNAILDYKALRGISPKAPLTSATWEDIDRVITTIQERALFMQEYHPQLAIYITHQILPMIMAFKKVLQLAELPASFFFEKDFTVDTGQIVNQGRAFSEFKGLVTQEDLPLTPNEEKGYGDTSYSSMRGYVWRWAPNPFREGARIATPAAGKKNKATSVASMTISQLDCRNLAPVTKEGTALPQFTINGVELEHADLSHGTQNYLYPGIVEDGGPKISSD